MLGDGEEDTGHNAADNGKRNLRFGLLILSANKSDICYFQVKMKIQHGVAVA